MTRQGKVVTDGNPALDPMANANRVGDHPLERLGS